MPKEYVKYELWLGSFEGERFKWKKLETFDDYQEAYSKFKKFVNKQVEYNDAELLDVWESPRLDIELKQGERIIDWVGIYTGKSEHSVSDSFLPPNVE